jgi:hypothetical protein
MYCPKCSQQQISDEMRFCSRCGFSLAAVRDLIDGSNEAVELTGKTQSEKVARSPKSVRRGAWLILASVIGTIPVGFLTAIEDEFAVFLFLPFLCFIVGLAHILYGVFVSDRKAARAAETRQNTAALTAARSSAAAQLPPSRVAPVGNFTPKRTETAEMIQPPSVTENTTRLLEEETDARRP